MKQTTKEIKARVHQIWNDALDALYVTNSREKLKECKEELETLYKQDMTETARKYLVSKHYSIARAM